MKKSQSKNTKVVNEFPSDVEIENEVRRDQECMEFIGIVAEIVKKLPNISFDLLKDRFKFGELELSLALFFLTSNAILYKGRFGYFHMDKITEKVNSKTGSLSETVNKKSK